MARQAGAVDARGQAGMADPRGQLVRTIRALSRLGLVDLRGVASIRLPSGQIVTTPRPGSGPVAAELTVDDLVTLEPGSVGPSGEVGGTITGGMSGRWSPPLTISADIELYRRHPTITAVVHGQPLTALAFAAARRPLQPLTHTESALVLPSLPVHGEGELVRDQAEARAFADALGDRPIALLPGVGSIAAGATIAEAGMLTHQLELLAKINAVAALEPDRGQRRRIVAQGDADRISAQKAPAADFQDFFDQVAEPRPTLDAAEPSPDDDSEPGLRARITAACQLLFDHGLIQSLEHVSVRLPSRDAFLMTPRRHLGRLRPDEIAIVGMDGRWQSGRLAPPPFLWLHRDIFAARPEVRAIVHTHQSLVRGLLMAGVIVPPLYRGGAGWAATVPAVHETPDLMFDADQRSAALAVLGSSRVLHEVSHGSDFLAGTVEEATVGALQLERQAWLWQLASRLGTPRPLPGTVLARLSQEEPDDLAWWRYFRSELAVGSTEDEMVPPGTDRA